MVSYRYHGRYDDTVCTVAAGASGGSSNSNNSLLVLTMIMDEVVACLTGMPQDAKERLHGLVEAMGGRFTRDLNCAENTHLVACEPVGAKYEAAVAQQQLLQKQQQQQQQFTTTTSTTTTTASTAHSCMIQIVKPSWIEACWKEQRLVDCSTGSEHDLLTTTTTTTTNRVVEEKVVGVDSATARRRPTTLSLEEALHQRLLLCNNSTTTSHMNNRIDNSWLFSGCHICLVGFNKTEAENGDNDDDDDDLDGHVLYQQLTRLIRRCMGTIYWESSCNMNVITHMIANNREAVPDHYNLTSNKTNNNNGRPVLVSPRWVVDSCRDGKLLPVTSTYLPECRSAVVVKKSAAVTSATTKLQKVTVAAVDKVVATTTTGTTPSIFRGSVFVLLRGVVPPEFAVDFDGTALEAAVVQHSGQMLSLPLLDALKSDLAAAANTTTTKRTCYVICWGGGVQHELHPLLAQVKRFQLCDVVPVTPIWLQTCVTEQKCVHPSRMPELFQPSNRPIYAFSDNKRNSNKQQQQKEGKKLVDNNAALSSSTTIRISVTGFSGSQRTAMIHLIRAMGGTYDDSMLRTATTHLICAKEVAAAGAGVGQQHTKYAKAVEWKSLHIVTIEWLYHVARHGLLPDKDNSSGGGSGSTEERFAVVAPAISDH